MEDGRRKTEDERRLSDTPQNRPPSSVSRLSNINHMDNLHFTPAYDEQNVSAVRELLTEYAQGQGLRPEVMDLLLG